MSFAQGCRIWQFVITCATVLNISSSCVSPVVAQSATAATSFGPRPVTNNEAVAGPYRYIGRITNFDVKDKIKGGAWGTGTLIGSRYVLTAAHVIQEVYRFEATNGKKWFILPDGRSSEIESAVIDSGWAEHGLITFDIGVCRLKDPLGKAATWGAFDAATIGEPIMLAGYDGELAKKSNQIELYVRQAMCQESTAIRTGKWPPAKMLVGAGAYVAGIKSHNGLLAGAGATYAAFQYAKAKVYDDQGWESTMVVYKGASGAPIWKTTNGRAVVIGVQSHSDTSLTNEPQNVGSRITPGSTDRMIQDFMGIGQASSP